MEGSFEKKFFLYITEVKTVKNRDCICILILAAIVHGNASVNICSAYRFILN